ncbi:DNA (cytosine-5-)-methyltransferase [Elizabethkingia anophelis]|nr:DNA (cytosine-5-)-methyltransferase [Elizabethkingia anophelis]MCT4275593.1 DNA (cytosine-5-)-methyltransferase [Elizabethkingia anophelis]MCT4278379.1 DNA (cytosine-5-)-methyltransferase [Elizabethkingia anophelis]
MSKKFSVGSLYAGVGGICLGFKNSGFKILWANEYDKNACITYRNNFSHTLYENDVMELNINEISKVDIVAGGFPCQPFSVAGYRKGFDDHRGNHFFKILEFVDKMRPKVIFLENVKNLVTHDKGNTFKVIEQEIEKRGYTFDSKVLNTKDFGNIPHNRERIFIVAFDKDFIKDKDFKFQFPKKEILTKKVNDLFIKDKVEDIFYYGEDKYMYHMLKEVIVRNDTIYQFRRQYVRENKSNVCPTLTANMGTGGHNVPLIKSDFGYRKLTPRECFRFQGFPDSFKLPNLANSHLYKQAGNSVSVPIIEKLSKEILKVLELNS